MKNLLIVLVSIMLFSTLSYSQIKKERFSDKSKGKFEQLEQIKLIEALELSEEATLKFFARRSEHRKAMQQLYSESDNLLKELSALIDKAETSDDNLRKSYKNYLSFEQRILEERHSFIKSLDDILSEKQITTLIIFEKRFKQELKEIIIHERKRRRE